MLIKAVTMLLFRVVVNYDCYNVRVVDIYGYLITPMIHYCAYFVLHEGQRLEKNILHHYYLSLKGY